MSSPAKILELDVAKGIAIVLVCIYHFSPPYAPEWWHTIVVLLAGLHMPLFIAISGWLYVHTRKEGISYFAGVANRFRRLMIPYLSVSALIITIKLLSGGDGAVDNPVTPYAYLQMFYEPVAGYFLWFIWAVMLMSMLVSVSASRGWVFFMALFSLVLYFLPIDFPMLFALRPFKVMFVFYMAGVLLREYAPTFEWVDRLPLYVIAPLFVIADVVWVDKPDMYILVGFAGILFGLRISRLACRYIGTRRLFIAIGGASYTIYLFHTTFMGFAKSVVGRIGLDGAMFPLVALCVIAAGVGVPYCLNKFVFCRWRLTQILFLGSGWRRRRQLSAA